MKVDALNSSDIFVTSMRSLELKGDFLHAWDLAQNHLKSHPTDGNAFLATSKLFRAHILESQKSTFLKLAKKSLRNQRSTDRSMWLLCLRNCQVSEAKIYAEISKALNVLKGDRHSLFRTFKLTLQYGHLLLAQKILEILPVSPLEKPLLTEQRKTLLEMTKNLRFFRLWPTRYPPEQTLSPELPVKLLVQDLPNHAFPTEPPKNICLVSWGLGPGGAERQVVNTLNSLQSLDPQAKLSLVLQSKQESWQKENFFLSALHPSVQIHYLDELEQAAREHLKSLTQRQQMLLSFCPEHLLTEVLSFAALWTRTPPQVVHIFQDSMNLHAGLGALLAKVPRIVLSGRNMNPKTRGRGQQRYYRSLYRTLLSKPSVLFSHNSRAGAESYRSWLSLPKSYPMPVVYNGIEAPPAPIFLRKPETFTIGSVARFHSQKNPLLWLSTTQKFLHLHPEARIISIGQGPMLKEIKERVAAAGLEDFYEFLGHSEQVVEEMKRFDVLLSCSKVEGLSNVLIEAQMLGLPVVCTQAGGSFEIVDQGQTGFVVPQKGRQMSLIESDLLKHLEWIYKNPQWTKNCNVLARKRSIDLFSIPQMAQNMLRLYQRQFTEH